jgi:ribonuclease VapC
MILDSSAIIAVLRAEREAPDFANAIQAAGKCRVSAVNYVETAIIIDGGGDAVASRRFDDFFARPRLRSKR